MRLVAASLIHRGPEMGDLIFCKEAFWILFMPGYIRSLTLISNFALLLGSGKIDGVLYLDNPRTRELCRCCGL